MTDELIKEALWELLKRKYSDHPKWEDIQQAKKEILIMMFDNINDDEYFDDYMFDAIDYCVDLD